MAPHSSTPAWKIPWMGEPGGLQSMRVSLECNPEIPVVPGEGHYVLDKSLDEVYFALQ